MAAAGGSAAKAKKQKAQLEDKIIDDHNARIKVIESDIKTATAYLRSGSWRTDPSTVDHSGAEWCVLNSKQSATLERWNKVSASWKEAHPGKSLKKLAVARKMKSDFDLSAKPKAIINNVSMLKKRLRTPVNDLTFKSRLPYYVEHMLGCMVRYR